LQIGIAMDQTAQDRFATDELASGLGSRADVVVRVSETLGQHPMIVLKRNGSGPNLPQPGEHPGPDSREAYTIKVT
jgi:hypothetical protein